MRILQSQTFTDERITKITGRIKIIFIIFICLGILEMIYGLSELLKGTGQGFDAGGMIAVTVCTFLYMGLRYRKKWVIPLVLIVSALMLLNTCFHILQPVARTEDLFLKIGAMVMLMFSLYFLYFFSRKEVKVYFGAKDKYFF